MVGCSNNHLCFELAFTEITSIRHYPFNTLSREVSPEILILWEDIANLKEKTDSTMKFTIRNRCVELTYLYKYEHNLLKGAECHIYSSNNFLLYEIYDKLFVWYSTKAGNPTVHSYDSTIYYIPSEAKEKTFSSIKVKVKEGMLSIYLQ